MKLALPLRLTGICLLWTGVSALLGFGWSHFAIEPYWLGIAVPLVVGSVYLSVSLVLRPVHALVRAIAGTIASYRDGEFSFGLVWPHQDAFGELVSAHNRLGQAIRTQRQDLVHRELLLHSVVQSSPLAIVLLDASGKVSLANIAARQLLFGATQVEGKQIRDLYQHLPSGLSSIFESLGEGIVQSPSDDDPEIYHVSGKLLRLNGRVHHLFVVKHMTQALRRQEVETWKKLIRIISHELNNSLAPISSLAGSGKHLIEEGRFDRLGTVLSVIKDRASHLSQFISGYASFARLPQPVLEACSMRAIVESMSAHASFQIVGEIPTQEVWVDRPQIEQALLNILKNAEESGSATTEIQVRVGQSPQGWVIMVQDRGPGMSSEVLEQALLPFYSTKRSGTGLGLALSREIVEAHGGTLTILNREEGGLEVRIRLPTRASTEEASLGSRL